MSDLEFEDNHKDQPKDDLGSLSQKARTKSLKSAQTILIIVGILSLLVNGGLFFMTESLVDKEIEMEKKKLGPGMVFDNVKIKEIRDSAIRTQRLLSGAFVLASIAFIILGICVYKAPVLCTVTGLVLYIAAWLIPVVLLFLGGEEKEAMAALIPKNIIGIGIKVLIIVGLFKSVQAAVAYQAAQREEF
ncbi:hypothetical protein BH11PLA2_BH11PLA2_07200 [soil metagenome]